ncbi:hypothetical protein Acr_15g0015610 [Actinidia rufa]|uniref:Uncharacterized protein n=1 Tax=Actinidia rufa TaxID=165716 RepID=A0A7J0FW78_9ERIC|nr:hypothetical protein Acr_15g0015610 [Actinidia rufa]
MHQHRHEFRVCALERCNSAPLAPELPQPPLLPVATFIPPALPTTLELERPPPPLPPPRSLRV